MVGGIVGGIVGLLLLINAIAVAYCLCFKNRERDVQAAGAGQTASQGMPLQHIQGGTHAAPGSVKANSRFDQHRYEAPAVVGVDYEYGSVLNTRSAVEGGTAKYSEPSVVGADYEYGSIAPGSNSVHANPLFDQHQYVDPAVISADYEYGSVLNTRSTADEDTEELEYLEPSFVGADYEYSSVLNTRSAADGDTIEYLEPLAVSAGYEYDSVLNTSSAADGNMPVDQHQYAAVGPQTPEHIYVEADTTQPSMHDSGVLPGGNDQEA